MKKAFIILAVLAIAFAGCHKDPQNGGNDNGGGNGGNGGGGNGNDTPTETSFTVTFDANGGTGEMPPMIFAQGVSQTLPDNAFTFEGHSFAGWNTKADGTGTSYSDKQTIVVTKSMTLYAQWEKYLYTVTFDANGGSGTMQPQTFTKGESQALTANAFIRSGYVFASWNTDPNGTGSAYTDMQEITVSQNMTLYAQWRLVPEGSTGRLFSVAADKQVFFSQGNLQYRASTNTWRFAESQVDYIGSNNTNISSSYSGWIDLFGWGTGNNTTNSSTSYSNYSSFTDWGSKPISNGGNQANQWRTLTNDEWNFLMFNRSTSSGIRFAKAKVNGVAGVIILPDDWSSSYYTLSSTNTYDASFYSNTISSSEWTNSLEAHGAVFLPAAGFRDGSSVYNVSAVGMYWSSSTPYVSYYAYRLDFGGSGLYVSYAGRYSGYSVRLVAEE